MNEQTKERKKRYYNVGDTVWAMSLKSPVKVKEVNTKELYVVVDHETEDGIVEHTLNLWQVDILKYREREKIEGASGVRIGKSQMTLADLNPAVDVKMAKIRPSAIIPTKRKEDAGYDIYANVETNEGGYAEIWCPKGQTTLIPTGIAMALPDTHYFNAKHERGSTGKIGLSVLAGVVDSGYRGELFIAVSPLSKDVLITSDAQEVEEHENAFIYPYSKAIAQGTIELVPNVKIEEITYEELLSMKSERGVTKLGQSGK